MSAAIPTGGDTMLKRLTSKLSRLWHRHRDHELRLNALEAAVTCLAESRAYVPGENVGLNGQVMRKKVVAELAAAQPFDVVVETGTWFGDTAGYFATTLKLPVYSCELHPIPHTMAKMRLGHLAGVHLEMSDSRVFLTGLAARIPPQTRCLFYLDAHWHSDLPLAEELRIIAGAWREYVIMIDDFRVPGDGGYRYDSYGRGRTLCVEDFAAEFARHGLVRFFPAAPSTEETGFKRGYVVLAPAGVVAERVGALASLVAK